MIFSVELNGQTGRFMILFNPLKSVTNLKEAPSALGTNVALAQNSVGSFTGVITPSAMFFYTRSYAAFI